ncbi:MAG: hypothetical protein ACRDT6_05520 [Micromonosporaceae bacterium]
MRGTAVAGVLTAALIGLAGCGGSEPDKAGGASPEPTAEASPTGTTAASPTAAAPTARIEIKGGKVTAGSGRHKVALGSTVVLEIVTDTADQVHVHGYDKEFDLTAGRPNRVEFTANIPGVFEVELHESGLALFELQVQ